MNPEGNSSRMRLVVMVVLWALAWAGPERRSGCGLANITISVESEECGSCIAIETSSCAGLCETKESPYQSSTARSINQNICNFGDVSYKTIQLEDCRVGANPFYTYPVAQSCRCSQCNTDSTDCGALSMATSGCQAQ